jgi:flagellar basal body-associated protein FliL
MAQSRSKENALTIVWIIIVIILILLAIGLARRVL